MHAESQRGSHCFALPCYCHAGGWPCEAGASVPFWCSDSNPSKSQEDLAWRDERGPAYNYTVPAEAYFTKQPNNKLWGSGVNSDLELELNLLYSHCKL